MLGRTRKPEARERGGEGAAALCAGQREMAAREMAARELATGRQTAGEGKTARNQLAAGGQLTAGGQLRVGGQAAAVWTRGLGDVPPRPMLTGGHALGVQRQVAGAGAAGGAGAASPVAFGGCSSGTRRLVQGAARRARAYIEAAIAVLDAPPAPGSVYAEALAMHFAAPADRQRRIIRQVYRRMLAELSGRNFVCAPAGTRGCSGTVQAFWLPADDLVHICPRFQAQARDEVCTAVILIHELAHDAGIDLTGTHVLNRGTPAYPVAGGGPPRRPSTARGRSFSPDAYAFFAAHIHNGADTEGNCF